MHRADGRSGVHHAEHARDHVAAVVDFGDDPVRAVRAVRGDGDVRPLSRRVAPAYVRKHIDAPVESKPGDDDSCLVAAFMRRDGRVDRNDYALKRRRDGGAAAVDHGPRPESARRVGENLAVELLTPEASRAVARGERRHHTRRKVAGVVRGAPSRDRRRGRSRERTHQWRWARRRGHHHARVGADTEAHLKLVPRVGVAPRRELVAPRRVVLRAAQLVRLFG